jgi:hypothetical protein
MPWIGSENIPCKHSQTDRKIDADFLKMGGEGGGEYMYTVLKITSSIRYIRKNPHSIQISAVKNVAIYRNIYEILNRNIHNGCRKNGENNISTWFTAVLTLNQIKGTVA